MPIRRNTRGRRPNKQTHSVSRLTRELHGHENRLRTLDPPATNRRPYYSIVVSQTYLSDGSSIGITVEGIVKALLSQLGLPQQAAAAITIKLQRADFYAISKADSDVRPSLTCDYSSLSPTIADPTTPGSAIVSYPLLKRLIDLGGVTSCAKVSYTWPLHMRDIPLSNTANFTVCDTATNLTEIDARFHLQWSSADIATPIP